MTTPTGMPCPPSTLCPICREHRAAVTYMNVEGDGRRFCDRCWTLVCTFDFGQLAILYARRNDRWPNICASVLEPNNGAPPHWWCQRRPHERGRHKAIITSNGIEHTLRWRDKVLEPAGGE